MYCKEQLFTRIYKTSTCWLWLGSKHQYGYGLVNWKGKSNVRVHRLIYTLFKGSVPNNLFVCHSCDVRNCVRLSHLWLGTNQDNLNDMKMKGRSKRNSTPGSFKAGEQHKLCKINNKTVRIIKAKYKTGNYTHKELGLEYKIHQSQISRIINYR